MLARGGRLAEVMFDHDGITHQDTSRNQEFAKKLLCFLFWLLGFPVSKKRGYILQQTKRQSTAARPCSRQRNDSKKVDKADLP